MGFNCLKAKTTSRRQFTLYHSVPRNSWYSFYRPQKDERLSRPWSHPVVLDTGLLDWESSALTTRPLLLLTDKLECKWYGATFMILWWSALCTIARTETATCSFWYMRASVWEIPECQGPAYTQRELNVYEKFKWRAGKFKPNLDQECNRKGYFS